MLGNRNNKLGSYLPVNLDFKDFVIQVTGREEQIQPATLNVEHMNLSGFRPSTSSFACLLQMCPRLYKLHIYFQSFRHTATRPFVSLN
ncbi:unnamed protein product [Cuscuta epithymum]|uniref:Uncharacterized protein n=1 Tax=Cuscuta epithymum TaxID=186058 RepID=A0AAV0DCT0_9ASTE|nr:unnamed protein product [Cuscuta epithymum]